MALLIETSMLVRLGNTKDDEYSSALRVVTDLHDNGEKLYTAPQNLIEFCCVATRPLDVNGLGHTPELAEEKATLFEQMFTLLPENDAIFPAWKALVKAGGVIGKQVHDARLVAICQVYSINQIVTFNARHFIRIASFVPGLTVIDPRTIQT